MQTLPSLLPQCTAMPTKSACASARVGVPGGAVCEALPSFHSGEPSPKIVVMSPVGSVEVGPYTVTPIACAFVSGAVAPGYYVTDPRGLITAYVYDGLDNLIQVTSPDTATTVYVFDGAGNRVQQTDAAGVVVQASYDALNRLTAKTYPADASENVTYRYDEPAAGFGVGRLTSVSDSSGSTAYVYDARGNVVQETHLIGAQSYMTNYAYDLANHVAQITYPSGRIVSHTRDSSANIVTSAAGYDPLKSSTSAPSRTPNPLGVMRLIKPIA